MSGSVIYVTACPRLAVVKEEKAAMAKALERLQMTERGPAPGQDWMSRDAVRMLEEQLVKERAKSQRSTSKRCQEQRLLMEQVKLEKMSVVISFLLRWF